MRTTYCLVVHDGRSRATFLDKKNTFLFMSELADVDAANEGADTICEVVDRSGNHWANVAIESSREETRHLAVIGWRVSTCLGVYRGVPQFTISRTLVFRNASRSGLPPFNRRPQLENTNRSSGIWLRFSS